MSDRPLVRLNQGTYTRDITERQVIDWPSRLARIKADVNAGKYDDNDEALGVTVDKLLKDMEN